MVSSKVLPEVHLGLGGGERDRTVDLRLAKPALSQLSYTPVSDFGGQINRDQIHLTPDSCLLIPEWWAWVDSNYRPHAYQACALTN